MAASFDPTTSTLHGKCSELVRFLLWARAAGRALCSAIANLYHSEILEHYYFSR